MSDHTHCATCGSTLNRIYHNRLDGADGWVYVCPTCEDKSIGETEPAVPHCIQCGRPMTRARQAWACNTCCWVYHEGQWSHDTIRLAANTRSSEPTGFPTMPEAYCAGFLTAWNKALQLCRSIENQLGGNS